MASLTPFRFSCTQDRGNGKNPVPSSPCPQLQSIALVAAGRNAAKPARGAKEAEKVAEPQDLPSLVGLWRLGDTSRWSVSVVFPTGQPRSAIVCRLRPERMRVRALVRLTGTLLSKMGSGNRLTWAAVYAYAAGYRLRECPRGRAVVQCDPIEKKPFFHAYPGALAYSFGMLGCDLHCSYCQNWVTSQALRSTWIVRVEVWPDSVSANSE